MSIAVRDRRESDRHRVAVPTMILKTGNGLTVDISSTGLAFSHRLSCSAEIRFEPRLEDGLPVVGSVETPDIEPAGVRPSWGDEAKVKPSDSLNQERERETMTKIRIAITSVLLSLAVAFPLAAECGIDPVTGEGFCGKGDVMTGLGYKANRQVEPILFRYTDSATYIQSCVNVNSHVNVTHDFTRVRNVKADLTTIVRKNGKKLTNITGYLLSGYDDIIPPPFIPGTDLCPSFGEAWVADPNGQYPEATLVSGTGGQLTASDGSRYVPLWPVVLSWGYCSDLTGPASQVCQLP